MSERASSKVVLATATWYHDPGVSRFRYAKKFLEKARGADLPVVVSDGSPDKEVSDWLKSRSTVYVRQDPRGLSFAHRQVIGQASKLAGPDGIVVYIETEKHDMVRLVPILVEPIQRQAANLALPSRTEKSWASYPLAQVYLEKYGALVHRLLTKRVVEDIHMGPMAMDRAAVDFFLAFEESFAKRDGSPWHFLMHPRIAAARSGALRIVNVPVDFQLDPGQRAEETGDITTDLKRLSQMDLVRSAVEVAGRYP